MNKKLNILLLGSSVDMNEYVPVLINDYVTMTRMHDILDCNVKPILAKMKDVKFITCDISKSMHYVRYIDTDTNDVVAYSIDWEFYGKSARFRCNDIMVQSLLRSKGDKAMILLFHEDDKLVADLILQAFLYEVKIKVYSLTEFRFYSTEEIKYKQLELYEELIRRVKVY